jgi:glycosyltransferase involved in cell wall biosynthesis
VNRAPHVWVLGNVLAQPPSGVRRHAEQALPRAAKVLREAGGSLSVIAGRRGLPFELGPDVDVIETRLASAPPWRRLLEEGRTLRRLRKDRPFDVLHAAHLPLPRGFPDELTRLVWLVHDLRQRHREFSGPLRAALATRMYRGSARRADRIVTVSRHVARELAALAPTSVLKTTIAANGADHFEPQPRAAHPDYLLALGHLEPRKNLRLLLYTLALDPELPPVLFAGRDKHGERAELEAIAAELGLAHRIRFHGAFDDAELPSLYAGAACVVVPSRLEGFGLAVAEAQRTGCPVAIARAGALSEVAGPFASSFDPDSPEACAHAIRIALARPASELEAGKRHASRYRWQRCAERLVAAWSEAAEVGSEAPRPG